MKQIKVILPVVAVALLAGVGGYMWSGSGERAAPVGASVAQAANAGITITENDMVLGDAKAPVTVVEYASMSCSHCASFHNETFKAFKEKYIDTGKVHFVFREFPLNQPAFLGAVVARCVGRDRFFPMLDVLFKKQREWLSDGDPLGALRKLGKLGGLSDAAMDACLKDEELQKMIFGFQREANEKFGVDSTPTFLVNGERYPGVLSIEELDRIIAKHGG